MIPCPSCATPQPADGRFCSRCGNELPPRPDALTELAPSEPPPPSPTPATGQSSASGLGGARFAPGTLLAGRYRIVGLLGKGGMGEVYRAEDLLLEQAVALKFLPVELAGDEDRLSRLLQEVRLARQVSHPNVCRVYDVGEIDGHRFFTMELVEGDDLGSLLRQVGRVPGEKAVDLARQICAGLAAAHDQRVVHRDLKPANLMIDRSGKVRITDFGLALAGEAAGGEAFAGTPAYMAPEQLAGREATARSDIWSLGVVLYELFTGQKPFGSGGTSVAELRRAIEQSTPTQPSQRVSDLDPAVERVVLRCLAKDPADRPTSALAVAAALPGGDPLAAALAAGETPSPEMVAAAGGEGGLRPAAALALVTLAMLSTLVLSWNASRRELANLLPEVKAPAVLQERARELLAKIGHTAPIVDSARDWFEDSSTYRYFQRTGEGADTWDPILSGRTPALLFVLRQTPRPWEPPAGFTTVEPDRPALQISGEAQVFLDPSGRLVRLDIVTSQRQAADSHPSPPSEVDWTPLLRSAELDTDRLRAVTPEWRPPFDVDTRAAWEGEYPELPGIPMRFEAAAVDGRPVFFRAIGPWTRAEQMETEELTREERIGQAFSLFLSLLALFVAGFLAWRNLRLGRGDRPGALRFATWFFVVHTVVWAIWADHAPSLGDEWNIVRLDVGYNLLLALSIWLLYIGVEPYVRRQWPETLIGWSRLLNGRILDPRVGRDVLVGMVVGLLMSLANAAISWSMSLAGAAPTSPRSGLTTRSLAGAILDHVVHSTLGGMQVLLLLLVLLLITRRRAWSVGTFVVLVAGLFSAGAPEPLIAAPILVATLGLVAWTLVRQGVLAIMVAFYVTNVPGSAAATTNFDAWYAWQFGVVLAVLVGLIAYGAWTATGGRLLAGDRLLEV